MFRSRRPVVFITGLVLAIAGVAVAAALFGVHSQPTGWIRVWSGSFAGPAGSAVNSRTWRYQTGKGVFGNNETETMTDSAGNVSLTGHGSLGITALDADGAWTSGRIKTRRSFSPPPGGEMLVSASIRQPDPAAGLGYWPAFWMLGPGQWPETGEIDILEDVNARSDHSGALHCGNGIAGPCHGHIGIGSGLLRCAGCQTGFHTYSVIIDRRHPGDEQIRWYLDGRQFFSVSEPQVGAATWTAAVDHGFSIILDLAIGGVFPDANCGCQTPAAQTSSGGTMLVRRVAVYDRT